MKRYLMNTCNRHKHFIASSHIKETECKHSTMKSASCKRYDSGITLTRNMQKRSDIMEEQEGLSDIPKNFEQAFYKHVFNETNTIIKKEENDNDQKTNDIDQKTNDNTRTNEINIQMLPKSLYEQIFKSSYKQNEISEREVQAIKNDLRLYGIEIENATRLPDVDITIPPLEGDDIEQHFYNIAEEQIKPYVNIIKKIIEDIPKMPTQWVLHEGWTRYTPDGVEFVDHPLEDGIVFDVEVCMKEGPLPTLAAAVTSKAWYGWVSKSLIDGTSRNFEGKQFTMDELIPMESTAEEHGEKLSTSHKKPKIVVGHNVSFDRSKIKEQYWLKNTGLRFIDTMSLHIAVGGINSYQRSVLKSVKDTKEKTDLLQQTSLNSLAEIHKYYCNSEINKDRRDTFVNGTLADVKQDFNALMTYCANDVIATHNVLVQLFPLFTNRFPHPVTLGGMLELSTAYLPVNSNWQRYLNESESVFEDLNYETKFILAKRANAVCQLMHNEKYKQDLWMWSEDWSTSELKVKKAVKNECKEAKNRCKFQSTRKRKEDFLKHSTKVEEEEEEDSLETEFGYLKETRSFFPKKLPRMPGYPAWYRKLCPKVGDDDWLPGPQNISTSMQIVPKLLNLTWDNYPLHYIKGLGWGILVPYRNDLNIDTTVPLKQLLTQCPLSRIENESDRSKYTMSNLDNEVQNELHKNQFWRNKKRKPQVDLLNIYKGSALWCDTDIDNCCYFLKLPHKNGTSYNVGNPLAKDFLNKFSEHVLGGLDASASEVLKHSRMASYWRNNRDRIMSQFVVWFEDRYLSGIIRSTNKPVNYGAIIPLVLVCGTLTRRAVEPTWMTASNADEERIGSELRAMIQAPPGYNIVGADVDSQELWISSIIGDSHYKKVQGATPFGWMTLMGSKSQGTDMHSITGKAVGISRNHAKVINYARIYGAGQKFAERLLKQFNPSMTKEEAAAKARKMFTMTKGCKVYQPKPQFTKEIIDKRYTISEAYRTAKVYGKTVSDMFGNSKWVGGSESNMFNRLEEIAGSPHPVTPFLNSRLTRALEDCTDSDKYLPTKVNWVVQSGAVDFLHLMLVSMKWLMKDNIRFCLSFHDEVRYLVPSRYKYNAALAMHITNLLTRSFCVSRLGMEDLPLSVAFFTSVEVDTVLRKESKNDCITPSNPHGLTSGYEIPAGESLDVWQAIEKSGGILGAWHKTQKYSSKTKQKDQSNKVSVSVKS